MQRLTMFCLALLFTVLLGCSGGDSNRSDEAGESAKEDVTKEKVELERPARHDTT